MNACPNGEKNISPNVNMNENINNQRTLILAPPRIISNAAKNM